MKDPKVTDMLEAGRLIASRKAPAYFRAALFGASFIQCADVPTFGIDEQWRVFVNPTFVMGLTLIEVAGCILHEVLHPTFEHARRGRQCQAHDHERWNAAGDREINPKVIRGGLLALPKGCLMPADLGLPDTLTAEEYYRLGGLAPKDNSPKECSGGSGAGIPSKWEEAAKQEGAPQGVSKTRAAAIRRQVAREMKEAAGKRPGSVPAEWLRWADEIVAPPRIPWEIALAGHLRAGAMTRIGSKPSYARPSRRLVAGGLVLPVHRAPRPRIVIVGDTSGSMGAKDLAMVLGAIRDACLAAGRVWAIACDAKATEPHEVGAVDQLKEHFRGGGGTDLRVGMSKAMAAAPDVLCVVTDGDTPWPREAPSVPTIVVLTRKPYAAPPTWATVVQAF